jgi:hypothetical protein
VPDRERGADRCRESALAQHRSLASLRLLDLDDHFGAGENLPGGIGNDRAGLAVHLVGRADACAGAGLNRHLMTMLDHLPNR